MRTLADIKNEIELLAGSDWKNMKKVIVSKTRNRIQFLKMIEMYLKESPTEDFIKKEKERIESRINSIMSLFNEEAYKNPKPAKLKFESDNGIPHLKQQLKTLIFILK